MLPGRDLPDWWWPGPEEPQGGLVAPQTHPGGRLGRTRPEYQEIVFVAEEVMVGVTF